MRKKAHLVPTDPIKIFYKVEDGSELSRVMKEQGDFISKNLKAPLHAYPLPSQENLVIEEEQELKELKDVTFKIGIIKLTESAKSDQV